MTKKDYAKAAKIVQLMRSNDPQCAPEVIFAFVHLFQSDNPNFDETKFREACKG